MHAITTSIINDSSVIEPLRFEKCGQGIPARLQRFGRHSHRGWRSLERPGRTRSELEQSGRSSHRQAGCNNPRGSRPLGGRCGLCLAGWVVLAEHPDWLGRSHGPRQVVDIRMPDGCRVANSLFSMDSSRGSTTAVTGAQIADHVDFAMITLCPGSRNQERAHQSLLYQSGIWERVFQDGVS